MPPRPAPPRRSAWSRREGRRRVPGHRGDPMSTSDVVVITGAGGMGTAVARRIGSGRTVLLADAFPDHLDRAVAALRAEGYRVLGRVTDIADRTSVNELAEAATAAGR